MSKHKTLIILGLVCLLGLLIRVYRLGTLPFGFFCDEAANGFNAYKLLTTGKDEYGVAWPFYFRSFGDYRTPVSIYSMIPTVALLGLNEFSVRLTNAIYGVGTIFLLYFFAIELGKQVKIKASSANLIGLTLSLLLATSPWHIHFSRTGFEYIPLCFYLTLSLLLFFKFLNSNSNKYLIFSTMSFVITFYTYYPIQIVLLPFMGITILLFVKLSKLSHSWQSWILAFLLFSLGLLPFVLAIKDGTAITRFNSLQPRNSKETHLVLIGQMLTTYLNTFSWQFLFSKGDIGFPGHFITRHSVLGWGELFWWQAPLVLLGLLWAFKINRQLGFWLIFWLLLYPIGSVAAFKDGPFANRSIFGLIPFQVLSALGLVFTVELVHKSHFQKIILAIFGLLLAITASMYLHDYFFSYSSYSSDYWGWQFGPREIINYYLAHKGQYRNFYMSGEFNSGEIFLKFYDPYNLCQNRCHGGDFFNTPDIVTTPHTQLFSLTPELLNKSIFQDKFLIKHTVVYPNGSPAFLIGEISP